MLSELDPPAELDDEGVDAVLLGAWLVADPESAAPPPDEGAVDAGVIEFPCVEPDSLPEALLPPPLLGCDALLPAVDWSAVEPSEEPDVLLDPDEPCGFAPDAACPIAAAAPWEASAPLWASWPRASA
ncbi:MAG: hypothetical protein ACRDPH_08015 [Marmoricola sp.]